MSDAKYIAIEIMGKIYQIKCSASEENALQYAAQYLEEKMKLTRASGVLSFDKMAVITALNIAHQLLTLEQQKNQHTHVINQRLTQLQSKVESALAKNRQMELEEHSAK